MRTESTPESDVDIMAIAVGDMSCYLGLQTFEHKEVAKHGYDAVTHEIRKFVRLAMNANPSVLEFLWLPENKYLYLETCGRTLLRNRDLFTSKLAYNSFSGYAYGQLYRLDHIAPTGALGAKRKKIVEEFGYDTKNAAHAIRLLNMSIEFLTEGVMYVDRSKKDGRHLQEIRAGKYSLDEIKSEATKLLALAREAYVRSPLPPKPDHAKCEELLMSILMGYHSLGLV